jgi:hypothetical protein
MNHEIEAIFLDVGNTLRIVIEDKAFSSAAKKQLAELVGVEEDPEAFVERLEVRYKA